MKIVFLDFDGVLNSLQWFKERHARAETCWHFGLNDAVCGDCENTGRVKAA